MAKIMEEISHFRSLRKTESMKVNLATFVEGDPKAPFSIASTLMCRGGRYCIPWIAPLYPSSSLYNAEC